MERNERMVCIKTGPYGSPTEGDLGTLVFGADYVPGLDAGRWTVKFDQPVKEGSALFGHACANYWTESEMRESWAPHYVLLSSEKPSGEQVDAWFEIITFYAGTGAKLSHEIDDEDGTLLVAVEEDGATMMARFDRVGTRMGDWF